ncbi:hypothetical protein HN958_02580 [Candidatus Falkowbacteria bacterium]|nr:hypothetical protein [Candidatus Falkowbacteria bacterium]MBT7007368.1 hypothetical protein [Candidatus Falkowbacteria bacterium]
MTKVLDSRVLDELQRDVNSSAQDVLKRMKRLEYLLESVSAELKERFLTIKASALFRLFRRNEAEAILVDVLDLNSESAYACGLLSKIMQVKKQHRKAVDYARRAVAINENPLSLITLLYSLFNYTWNKHEFSPELIGEICNEIERSIVRLKEFQLYQNQRDTVENFEIRLATLQGRSREVYPKLKARFDRTEKPKQNMYTDLISVALELGEIGDIRYYLHLAVQNKKIAPTPAWFSIGEKLRHNLELQLAKKVFAAMGFHHPNNCLHYTLCCIKLSEFTKAIETLQLVKGYLSGERKYSENTKFKYLSFVILCYDAMCREAERIPREFTHIARSVAREVRDIPANAAGDLVAFTRTKDLAVKYFV